MKQGPNENSNLIVIPAWNEEKNISFVIRELKEFDSSAQILVIDDGSIDKTKDIAKDLGVKVLSLPFNLGVGAAMRLGFKYAFENNYLSVTQLDADGQHIPAEISKLLEKMSDHDVVIGSRFNVKSSDFKVNLVRRFAMLVLAKSLSAITKSKLTDVTSGFRVSNRSAIEIFAMKYPPEYLGDTIESLVIAHKHGLKISEVNVKMRPRLHGTSSQSTIKALMYTVRAFAVLVLSLMHRTEPGIRKDSK